MYDQMDFKIRPIIGNNLPLIVDCKLDQNATSITEMFQLPEYCRNDTLTCKTVKQEMEAQIFSEHIGQEIGDLDSSGNLDEQIIKTWHFGRRIYYVSNFARVAVIIGFTVLATKVAHWCLGEENDPIGVVPVLDRML